MVAPRSWGGVLVVALVACASGPEARPLPQPDDVAARQASPGGDEMRKTPQAPTPLWVDGPPLEPEEGLRRWIAARAAKHPRALFRLPFTFAAGQTSRAALGLPGAGETASTHRLDDGALGISLADQVRRLRGAEAGPCAVWLSVRMGPLLGPALPGTEEPEDLPVAAVLAVHERVEAAAAGEELRAQAARGPDCLAVRLLSHGHCARGPAVCQRCAAAAEKPASPALLDLCPDGDAARPTLAVEREGQRTWVAYDVLRWFTSVEEARAFAARHGLDDVRLEARSE